MDWFEWWAALSVSIGGAACASVLLAERWTKSRKHKKENEVQE